MSSKQEEAVPGRTWCVRPGTWERESGRRARQEWRRKRCPQWSLHALMQPTTRRQPNRETSRLARQLVPRWQKL